MVEMFQCKFNQIRSVVSEIERADGETGMICPFTVYDASKNYSELLLLLLSPGLELSLLLLLQE
jgi:hypothetical protein